MGDSALCLTDSLGRQPGASIAERSPLVVQPTGLGRAGLTRSQRPARHLSWDANSTIDVEQQTSGVAMLSGQHGMGAAVNRNTRSCASYVTVLHVGLDRSMRPVAGHFSSWCA